MRYVLLIPALLLAGCATPARAPDVSETVTTQVHATVAALVPTAAPTASLPSIGEVGYLFARQTSGEPLNEVPVSGAPADFIAYVKSARAHDEIGVRQLLQSKRLITIRAGTKARVIDSVEDLIDVVQVRFIDGDWPQTTAWIDHTWIVLQLPAGFVAPTVTPR